MLEAAISNTPQAAINIAFFLIGIVMTIIYYLECWKLEQNTQIKDLAKVKGILYLITGTGFSGLTQWASKTFLASQNSAFAYYFIGVAVCLAIVTSAFPAVIALSEALLENNSSSRKALFGRFLLRCTKTLIHGAHQSVSEVEDQVEKSNIKRQTNFLMETHIFTKGFLDHLHEVEAEEEKRSELSFQQTLEGYLQLLLFNFFEENNSAKRFRAGIYYLDPKAKQLNFFTGVSPNGKKHSKKPLPLDSLGGRAVSENEILSYPSTKKSMQKREHAKRYKSFICIPIGSINKVDGLLTIDCIDKADRFDESEFKNFAWVLGSLFHLAGTIYR